MYNRESGVSALLNVLDAVTGREVIDANFNCHKAGELHPDRVLDFHDIVYILDGGWAIGQDGVDYRLEKGDVIFLHAGRHHYGVGGYLPGARTMYLHVSRSPRDTVVQSDGGVTGPEERIAFPVVVHGLGSLPLQARFQEIIRIYWSDRPYRSMTLSAHVSLLLAHLWSLGNAGAAPADHLVEEAQNLMRLTPGGMFTLDELSGMLHVCSRTLTSRFRRATGTTVHRYQLDLKLDMACMLMRDDPFRPFRILAENLGFSDEFHFSRLFKRKFGLSPKEYRNGIGRGG